MVRPTLSDSVVDLRISQMYYNHKYIIYIMYIIYFDGIIYNSDYLVLCFPESGK